MKERVSAAACYSIVEYLVNRPYEEVELDWGKLSHYPIDGYTNPFLSICLSLLPVNLR